MGQLQRSRCTIGASPAKAQAGNRLHRIERRQAGQPAQPCQAVGDAGGRAARDPSQQRRAIGQGSIRAGSARRGRGFLQDAQGNHAPRLGSIPSSAAYRALTCRLLALEGGDQAQPLGERHAQ